MSYSYRSFPHYLVYTTFYMFNSFCLTFEYIFSSKSYVLGIVTEGTQNWAKQSPSHYTIYMLVVVDK